MNVYKQYVHHVKVVSLLLERNDVDPSCGTVHQQTPLHFAASCDNLQIATMLLDRDVVDADARDES